MILGNDPDRDWERFGAEDPYYSILNTDAYRRDRLDARAIDEIFLSGAHAVQTILHFAERRFGKLPRRSALEYGCGVGRLQLALSNQFDLVTGVDVSPSMLQEAAQHCERLQATNIRLLLSDDQLSRVTETFDFILSYLVFQHIPVRRGESVLRQVLRRLNLGGVAALHFTTHRTSPPWRHIAHVLRRNLVPVHWAGNVLSGMRWNEPLMQTNLYRLERILSIATQEGIHDMALYPVHFGDHAGVMLFLYRDPEGYRPQL